MILTGKAVFAAIVGNPIEQVASPKIFNQRFDQLGIEAALLPIDIEEQGIKPLLDSFRYTQNFKGLIITLPYKQLVVQYLDTMSNEVRELGSCNVIVKRAGGLHGELTDGVGMTSAIQKHNINFATCNAIIAGCGGAGSAIAWSLLEAGVSSLSLRETIEFQTKSDGLAKLLSTHFPDRYITSNGNSDMTRSILINATRLGMSKDDPPVFNQSEVSNAIIIGDAVTRADNRLTTLASQAKNCGITCITGQQMAASQSRIISDLIGLKI
ncbi:MAG: hypothetical protein CL582_07290 [Alteromonadaceae bacterium]|nr:hypothetical protein [Alteromonadaceae bacterium]